MDLGGSNADLVRWSRAVARELLAEMDGRLGHMEAVGRWAEEVARGSPMNTMRRWLRPRTCTMLGTLGAAGDGLHPLDGARWLRAQGICQRVCNLVAHHSGARSLAEERGLLGELQEFDLERGPVIDGLTYADMTTGPDGRYVTFEERLDDILSRYPPGDPVHRAIVRARPVVRGP
jgi:hypothetical protein